jgi:hypothetical protein
MNSRCYFLVLIGNNWLKLPLFQWKPYYQKLPYINCRILYGQKG